MFTIGQAYTKNEIYEMLNVPAERRRGAWDTGYREFAGNIFIFSNINVPGRTGHDYNNYWNGDLFVWQAQPGTQLNQPLMQKMLKTLTKQSTFLFTRTDNRGPFTFEGNVKAKELRNEKPVSIVWQLTENYYHPLEELLEPDTETTGPFLEGSVKRISVNKYERNPLARRICVSHYGVTCQICGFDFYKEYGEIGRNFIHVHHVIPFSQVTEEYELDPIKDLIPICPNCHSMIHRTGTPLSVDKVKELVRTNKCKDDFDTE